jgi:hypothetical protein
VVQRGERQPAPHHPRAARSGFGRYARLRHDEPGLEADEARPAVAVRDITVCVGRALEEPVSGVVGDDGHVVERAGCVYDHAVWGEPLGICVRC